MQLRDIILPFLNNMNTDKKLHTSDDVMNSILNEVDTKLQELEKIHEDTHRYQNTLQGKIYGYREVRDIIKKYCS